MRKKRMRKQLKRPLRRKRKFLFSRLFNKKMALGGLFVSIIIFLPIFYLYQTNLIAQKGFEIRELEKQLTHLKQEHFDLEQDRVNFQSAPHIQASLNELEMVQVKSVDYIDSQFNDVALILPNSL